MTVDKDFARLSHGVEQLCDMLAYVQAYGDAGNYDGAFLYVLRIERTLERCRPAVRAARRELSLVNQRPDEWKAESAHNLVIAEAESLMMRLMFAAAALGVTWKNPTDADLAEWHANPDNRRSKTSRTAEAYLDWMVERVGGLPEMTDFDQHVEEAMKVTEGDEFVDRRVRVIGAAVVRRLAERGPWQPTKPIDWDDMRVCVCRECAHLLKSVAPTAEAAAASGPALTKRETFLMLQLLDADPRAMTNRDLETLNLGGDDSIDIGKGTVGHLLQRLIDIGYVYRLPAEKGDDKPGRKGVRLTDKGKTIAKQLKEHPPAIF
jgi:hypothetical protein